MHSSSSPYRPDIDGLRALAVGGVVATHAFPEGLGGGFMGVDVFFVISGFLIAGLLAAEWATGRPSLAGFYARRVRRLFPALALVLGTCLAAGSILLMPDELKALAKQAAAGAGFTANFLFWRQADYFDPASELKPLLHLWSLAVEEQFYLVFPLLLWGLLKTVGQRRARQVVAALALLSFVAGLVTLGVSRPAAFYAPWCRVWELLAGATAALWLRERGAIVAPALAGGIALAGLGLITLAMLAFNGTMPFPGWRALLPVAGALLVVTAGADRTSLAGRLLASRPLIGLGLVSYPLYLWHWPLLVLARLYADAPTSQALRLALVALALLLAIATRAVVEQPLRFGAHPVAKAAALVVALVLLWGEARLISRAEGYPGRLPADVQALAQPVDHQWGLHARMGTCHIQEPLDRARAPDCLEPGRPLLAFWGDSLAASLTPGLDDWRRGTGIALAQLTEAGCPPLFDLSGVPLLHKTNCAEINADVRADLTRLQPDCLVLHAGWVHQHYPMPTADLGRRLRATLADLRAALPRTRLLVLGPMPGWAVSPQKSLYQRWQRDHLADWLRPGPAGAPWAEPTRLPAELYTTADAALHAAGDAGGAAYLAPTATLCTAEGCLVRVAGPGSSFIGADGRHLSADGARLFVTAIAPELRACLAGDTTASIRRDRLRVDALPR